MLHLWPNRETFDALAARANTIPVYCQILSDQMTPVTAFQRLAGPSRHAFLLESVVGGEKIARYSFIGTRPSLVFEATGRTAVVTTDGTANSEELDDPLGKLEELLGSYRVAHLPELPRFVGGAVGYAGYDVIRYYENLPNAPHDDRQLPDLQFGLYDTMVIFDHVQKLIKIVAHAHVERDGVQGGYDDAKRRIEETVAALQQGPESAFPSLTPRDSTAPQYIPATTSGLTFCAMWIVAGSTSGLVTSFRWSCRSVWVWRPRRTRSTSTGPFGW